MSHSKEYLMPHSNWDIHIFYFFSSNFLIFKYVYTLYTVQTNFRKYLGPRSVAHPAFDARNCRLAVFLEGLRQHLKIAKRCTSSFKYLYMYKGTLHYLQALFYVKRTHTKNQMTQQYVIYEHM